MSGLRKKRRAGALPTSTASENSWPPITIRSCGEIRTASGLSMMCTYALSTTIRNCFHGADLFYSGGNEPEIEPLLFC